MQTNAGRSTTYVERRWIPPCRAHPRLQTRVYFKAISMLIETLINPFAGMTSLFEHETDHVNSKPNKLNNIKPYSRRSCAEPALECLSRGQELSGFCYLTNAAGFLPAQE